VRLYQGERRKHAVEEEEEETKRAMEAIADQKIQLRHICAGKNKKETLPPHSSA